MTRLASLLLALVVLVSTAAAVGVAADEVNLSVSKVTVDPRPPEPDEEFTVRTTLRNLQSSDARYEIDRVELRTGPDEGGSLEELDSISPPTSVGPGNARTLALNATLESAGLHQLYVHVYGTTGDGTPLHLQYPFELRVGDEHPQLDLSVDEAVANAETPVNVTVSNGLSDDLRNVELTVEGQSVSFEDDQRVRSRLASGEDAVFEYAAVAAEAGDRPLTATLRYTDADGERRTVSKRTTATFDALAERVELDASAAPDGSSVSVTVTNLGNAGLENVVVSESADAVAAGQRVVSSIPAGSSRTVTLNVSGVDADGRVEVPVVASYDLGTRTGEAETTTSIASNPGEIALTGVEVEPEGDRVHLTGSASNVGLSEANSVIVRVTRTEAVVPAQPNREYFVGTVPASDFVSFDVYARVDGNVSEIPLEVSYLVDGERRTREVAVEYDSGPDPESSAGDDDPLVPAVVGGLAVLLVGAIMAVAWRNSRGGA